MSKECCALILAELRACKEAIVESIRGIGSKRGDAVVRTFGVLGSEKPLVESASSGAQAAAPASCVDLGIAVQPVAAPDAIDCDVGLSSSPPPLSSAVPLQAPRTAITDKEASTGRDLAAALSPAVDADPSGINFDAPTICSTNCPNTGVAVPGLATIPDAASATSTTSALLDAHMASFTVSLAGDDALIDIGAHAPTICSTVCPLFGIRVPAAACVLGSSPTAPRTSTLRGAPTPSAALSSLVSVERATWSAHQAFDEMPAFHNYTDVCSKLPDEAPTAHRPIHIVLCDSVTGFIVSGDMKMTVVLWPSELNRAYQQPWPPPMQLKVMCVGANRQPMPWLSSNRVDGGSAGWSIGWLWKPPWPPPAQQNTRMLLHMSFCLELLGTSLCDTAILEHLEFGPLLIRVIHTSGMFAEIEIIFSVTSKSTQLLGGVLIFYQEFWRCICYLQPSGSEEEPKVDRNIAMFALMQKYGTLSMLMGITTAVSTGRTCESAILGHLFMVGMTAASDNSRASYTGDRVLGLILGAWMHQSMQLPGLSCALIQESTQRKCGGILPDSFIMLIQQVLVRLWTLLMAPLEVIILQGCNSELQMVIAVNSREATTVVGVSYADCDQLWYPCRAIVVIIVFRSLITFYKFPNSVQKVDYVWCSGGKSTSALSEVINRRLKDYVQMHITVNTSGRSLLHSMNDLLSAAGNEWFIFHLEKLRLTWDPGGVVTTGILQFP